MDVQILEPITFAASMVTACSVAEPDATTGEAAWAAATVYAIGDEVVRTTTHRVYAALASGADAGLPEDTPLRWFDTRPSNKYAAWDQYRNTATTSTATLTQTFKPGIITGLQFFGLVGDTIRVVCKNADTLATYYDQTTSLAYYLSGDLMWEFYFGSPRQQDGLRISGLYPQNAQVEITITVSTATATAAVGLISAGSWAALGLPKIGFTAKPVDYSQIKADRYGNVEIIAGLSAKNITGDCVMLNLSDAQAAADVVYRLLGTPCAVVVSDVLGYDYLNAFGLVSADITPAGGNLTNFALNIRGMI